MDGDTSKLNRLINQISRIESGGLMDELQNQIGEELLSQTQACFEESRTPYGDAWAPLVIRDGKPLQDNGTLANSFTVTAADGAVIVGTNIEYAEAHQNGVNHSIRPVHSKALRLGKSGFFAQSTSGIPARPFFPTGDKGLPNSYVEAIDDVATELLRISLDSD